MERAAKLLGQSDIARKCLSDGDLARAAWAKAVGPTVAAHSTVVALLHGRLVVEVDDSVWQSQLTTLGAQVLERLHKLLGREVANVIEFTLAARRISPGRAQTPVRGSASDDGIADPILGRLYRASRKKESA